MAKIHYVDNKSFYAALVAYKAQCREAEAAGKEIPRIPEYIGVCIYKIATKLSTKGNFVNYSFREEMISDGIENCINYMHNFNPDKSNNPFAYFTRILYNAYVHRIQKEKKQTYIKYKAYENAVLIGGVADLNDVDSKNSTEMSINDNMNAFVNDYEKKLEEKKLPKKKGLEAFIEGE
jgi:hypothetical protein